MIAFMRSKAGRARAAVPRSAILSAEAHCTGVSWPDSIKALTKQKRKAILWERISRTT